MEEGSRNVVSLFRAKSAKNEWNVASVALWGKDCVVLEDILDEYIVGDVSNERSFITTTSHPDEIIEDVESFVKTFDIGEIGDSFQIVHF